MLDVTIGRKAVNLTPSLLGRFLLSTPLLFLGVLMLIDPARFLLGLGNTAQAISEFEEYLRGFGSRRAPAPEIGQNSARVRLVTRLAGFVVAACAFAHLAGLVR